MWAAVSRSPFLAAGICPRRIEELEAGKPKLCRKLACVNVLSYHWPTMIRKAPNRNVLVVLAALFIIGSLPAQTVLAESKAYSKAGEYLLLYFQNKIMKSQEFIDRFGVLDWKDISQEVKDSMDYVRDRESRKPSVTRTNHMFSLGMYWSTK